MVGRRRFATTARARPAQTQRGRLGSLPDLYRGGRGRPTVRDIYAADQSEAPHGGHFRWLLSTCLAAAVGALAIVVVIYGSADRRENGDGLIPAFRRMGDASSVRPIEAALKKDDGLKWAVPKSNRLQVTTGTMTTRYVVHDTLKQRRGRREYIYAKPYVRIMMRLATVPPNYSDVIPPFNPYKLYANNKPIGAEDDATASGISENVSVRVVELRGLLPREDGQELDANEVQEIVRQVQQSEAAAAAYMGDTPEGDGAEGRGPESSDGDTGPPPNTTILAKPEGDSDAFEIDDFEGLQRFQRTVTKGDTLAKILTAAGAEDWLVKAMLEAARPIFPEGELKPGHEVQIGLAPSVTEQNKLEPVRLSVFDAGHAHKLTVARDASGEYSASKEPVGEQAALLRALAESNSEQPSNVYSSIYAASLVQQVPPETILQVLRINATDTDFRRRVRPGDSVELFFDLKDETALEGEPGDLLYTGVTSAGETRRFYRFRAADGSVDFYDENGNNSRKFLMRRPVRADDVRLTSGFGVRFHPVLNVRKMHTGVDWAAKRGTPILAAGKGTIEEAGRKGRYGNYIRIRHANGYQTAYGHMTRLAPGVAAGVKVRQGQTIGYVGSTGLSSGPHLHYEVLVNKQFVNPLSIKVPNERQLKGKDLAEFQAERTRIDELRSRAPVSVTMK